MPADRQLQHGRDVRGANRVAREHARRDERVRSPSLGSHERADQRRRERHARECPCGAPARVVGVREREDDGDDTESPSTRERIGRSGVRAWYRSQAAGGPHARA
jgi:hypothetical protein